MLVCCLCSSNDFLGGSGGTRGWRGGKAQGPPSCGHPQTRPEPQHGRAHSSMSCLEAAWRLLQAESFDFSPVTFILAVGLKTRATCP